MLGQRRRRWANIKPTSVQSLAFAGSLLESDDQFHPKKTGFHPFQSKEKIKYGMCKKLSK